MHTVLGAVCAQVGPKDVPRAPAAGSKGALGSTASCTQCARCAVYVRLQASLCQPRREYIVITVPAERTFEPAVPERRQVPNSEGDPSGAHVPEAAAAALGAEPGPGGWRHPQQGSQRRDGHRAAGPGGAGAVPLHNRFEALTGVHEETDDVVGVDLNAGAAAPSPMTLEKPHCHSCHKAVATPRRCSKCKKAAGCSAARPRPPCPP